METSEVRELLTPSGLRLLDSLPEYSSKGDIVRIVAGLRSAGHSSALVAAVLTQAKLRSKAAAKFDDFAVRMLFTEAGLEQATRLRVAALHAGRFSRAGITHVADLGCGIGADAMAMAGLGLTVTAVEADEVTAALASYNLAIFENVTVVHARAEEFDLAALAVEGNSNGPHSAARIGIYLDPARRTSGHSNTERLTRPEDYSPSLKFAFGLAERYPAGVKLGPGFDRGLIPIDAEAQWVSVDGSVVELGLWFGTVARPGITRSALVLDDTGTHEMNAPGDSDDVEAGVLGNFLYEPDGSVIRARLIGDLARIMGAHMLSERIAYLTSDILVSTPFARGFRILDEFPLDVKTLTREMRTRGIGTLEVKKRGVDIDPAEFRKKLRLQGPHSATLILTRIGERRTALLAERV
ncbi:50S ribosomal protein L11 methyltransferase [Alpinimonas psychrophila]|uniref:THUMP-like domain-containing protein n=1 Tax=Alpinimonas psychrophila TaxID=748908 RepID=UPI0015FD45EB